tara:strand:+ start:3793 stop:4080 length:288 start_codon:yes stop_codon:yes gene_type:complete
MKENRISQIVTVMKDSYTDFGELDENKAAKNILKLVTFFPDEKTKPITSLPVLSEVNKLITDEYNLIYGTNYNEQSLNNALIGAEILLEYLNKNL